MKNRIIRVLCIITTSTTISTIMMSGTRNFVHAFTTSPAFIGAMKHTKNSHSAVWTKSLSSLNVLNAPPPPPSSSSSSSSSTSSSSSSSKSTSTFIQVQKNAATPNSRSSSTSKSFSFSTTSSGSTCSSKSDERKVLQPLIVCGPSGVGKGTIIHKFMEDLNGKSKFGFTVSHTTRKPRPGEINNIHYHFTTIPSMEKAITNNEFLEYAHVHGNIYGTSLSSLSVLEENGMIPLLDIDVQGVKEIKKRQLSQQFDEENGVADCNTPELQAKYIFIAPPSLDLLLERLISRGTETEESIQKRSKNAIAEMEYGMEKGNFDAIIVNDDLDGAVAEFERVVSEMYGH